MSHTRQAKMAGMCEESRATEHQLETCESSDASNDEYKLSSQENKRRIPAIHLDNHHELEGVGGTAVICTLVSMK